MSEKSPRRTVSPKQLPCGGAAQRSESVTGGFPNFPFHSLVFGINELQAGKVPCFRAKRPCLGAFVQLLCNQECDGFLVLAFFSFQVFRYDLFTHSEAAMSPELNKTRPQILRRLAASICARHRSP